jgi:hypothetical protein
VGAYFGVQLLGNILVTASALGVNCTATPVVGLICLPLNTFASFGVSLVATNLLIHRYLHEKVTVTIKLHNTGADHLMLSWSAKLELAFKWEARSLLIVLGGMPLTVVSTKAASVVGAIGILLTVFLVRI